MTDVLLEQLPPTPSPLRLEPDGAFDTLRALLREADFDEDEICRRLEIASIDQFRALRDGRPGTVPRDALDMLVLLFLDNEPSSRSEAEALLPPGAVQAMQSLGLVRDHRDDPSQIVANVLLYPTESLYVASDVATLPDGGNARWWDLVYAAITTNTRSFLSTMPRYQCAAFLDLCSGTGIAALAAASTFAEHAWAIDVADRSTAFAKFNARLNAASNVTALTGDLYAPVAGMTFDRIVAHPPYVPARENTMMYRDGGSDGEHVTRRIIAGLGDHLRPGGRFHCICRATDRKDAPLEQRLRTMLGASAHEFDIAVILTDELDPTEYYVRMAMAGRGTWAEAEEWHHHFRQLGVTKLVYATIAMVRHTHPHAPFTVRRRIGSATGAAEVSRLLLAAEQSASPGALERLLESRPVLNGHVTLGTEHASEGGDWALRTAALKSDVPFDVRLPCPREMIALIGRMDGTQTVRELYDAVARAGTLADDATIERLASFIHVLVAHGFVDLHEKVTSA